MEQPMDTFDSVEDILDFAVLNVESFEFYTNIAEEMGKPELKRIFNNFAKEEEIHKKKLIMVKKGIHDLFLDKTITELNKNDYMVPDMIHPHMDKYDAFLLAIKKEKAAHALYMTIANHTHDEKHRNMFISLAQEEAKHKEKFEEELSKL